MLPSVIVGRDHQMQLALQVRATGAPYVDKFFALPDRALLERDARIQAHERRGVPESDLDRFFS
jgi:hypothetical protein